MVQVEYNLYYTVERVANPEPNASSGSTISQSLYGFEAKYQKSLLDVMELIHFYQIIRKILTIHNIKYNTIKKFTEQ